MALRLRPRSRLSSRPCCCSGSCGGGSGCTCWRSGSVAEPLLVMPGTRVRLRRPEHRPIVPGIHVLQQLATSKTWMAGTSLDKPGHDELECRGYEALPYSAVQPPSIERLAPVICAASSPQGNNASAATCPGGA